MSGNWVASLDLLAANGILDYDGAAFLRGTAPRYIGSPAFRTYPQPLPPTGVGMRAPLNSDTYNPADKPLVDNPTWKKLLFVGVAGAALIFGGMKFKNSAPIKWVTKQCNKAWNQIKRLFNRSHPQ